MKNYISCCNKCCKLFISDIIVKECEEYLLDNTQRSKSGIVLIDSKNRILISQSYNSFWGVPKGTQELGENFIETAIRETKEETGIILSKEIFKGNKSKIISTKKNIYNLFFIKLKEEGQQTISDPIKLATESTGCGWINIDCLKESSQKKTFKLNYLTKCILNMKF